MNLTPDNCHLSISEETLYLISSVRAFVDKELLLIFLLYWSNVVDPKQEFVAVIKNLNLGQLDFLKNILNFMSEFLYFLAVYEVNFRTEDFWD